MSLGAPAAFRPTDIPGITEQLIGQAGVVASGSDVTTWTGTIASTIFTSGANKPTYNASNADFRNKPTVHWSSTANQNLTSSLTISQPASYCIICKCDDQTAIRSLITLGHIIQAAVGPSGILVNAGSTGIFGTSLLTGGVHTLVVIVNGADTTVYLDGVAQALSSGVQNVGAQNNTNVQIGFTSVSWVGDIAEIDMWNGKAISVQEAASLHNYAQLNYGAI